MLSETQRRILRDMADGGGLYQQRGSMKYVLFPPGTEHGQPVPADLAKRGKPWRFTREQERWIGQKTARHLMYNYLLKVLHGRKRI